MLNRNFILQVLSDNSASNPIRAEMMISAEAAGKAVVQATGLDLKEFQRLGFCQVEPEREPFPDRSVYWGGEDNDRLYSHYQQVVWRVNWNGNTLRVVHLEWQTSCGGTDVEWVVADSVEIAESFILEVNRETHAPGEAILVFSNGYWDRSRDLYQATQSASLENLVLADGMKDAILSDFKQFLQSEERYRRIGMAWRRGALMIGPPGNGKTHCVRALVKELNIPSLYVQSLEHPHFTDNQMWQRVFQKARDLRPCILVLEDLDSLLGDENRSYFLNQLDGFEHNHGMIVLATTNYPDRIDAAIIDRPSRFDRKYHFDLPKMQERARYLAGWQQQLSIETGWKNDELDVIAECTDGFSFAYLKELIISSLMAWLPVPEKGFATVLTEQSRELRRQMKTENAKESKPRAAAG